MRTYNIVDIPSKMEKFYGKGTMLHPSIDSVEEIIQKIPKGYVATIDTITKQLSKDYATDVTCPMRTGNIIKKISERYTKESIDSQLPFWRVIRKDKKVIKSKNYEFSAALLEDEGFTLIFGKSGAIQVDVDPSKMLVL